MDQINQNEEQINQMELEQRLLEELELQRIYDEWQVDKEQLPEATSYLEGNNGENEIYVVGTAHVSEKSVEDVKKTIELVKPHTIMLELCKGRQALLFPQAQAKKDITLTELFENCQKNGVFPSLLSYFYGIVGKKLQITPGAEFSAAFQSALQINPKCNVVLGDRPVDVTLNRSWGFLSNYEKLKLLFMLVFSFTEINSIDAEMIEKMKSTDMITELVKELSKHFPSFLKYLLYERDMYLAKSISKSTEMKGKRIVAVVGMGHVEGIKKIWDKVDEIDLAPLMKKAPPSKLTFKRVFLFGSIAFLGLSCSLIYLLYLFIRWMIF